MDSGKCKHFFAFFPVFFRFFRHPSEKTEKSMSGQFHRHALGSRRLPFKTSRLSAADALPLARFSRRGHEKTARSGQA